MTSIASYSPIVSPVLGQTDALSAANLTDQAAAQQAAADIESLFVSMLLKQMRGTIGGDGLFGDDKSDVYGGLFDLYLGRHVAEGGGFGIAKLITQYTEAAQIK